MSEQIEVSAVMSALDTTTIGLDPNKVIETIRTGGKKLRGQVEKIRQVTREQGKKAASELKKQLPAVLWSGRFSIRANDALIEHSGLLCADLDSLNGELSTARENLMASPYVWAVFRSPSGDGLKVIFRVPADATKHAESFRAVKHHVWELTGVQIDESGKDVARLCFLSYDPKLHQNANAHELEPLPEPEKPKLVVSAAVNLSERQRIVTELIGQIDWQSETSGFVACPGKHLHTSGDNVRDCKIDFDGVPTVHCFHNSCRGILDGINHELRSRIGKAEYNGKHEAPEGRPKENSLNLFNHRPDRDTDDFPEPPSEVAFHGLAGDIVRRIEPHTEADPLAVLIQTLLAYGNAIGRSPHAIADGSRHGMNLFAVLVGESAKARKGTSLAHVLRIFERADEQWSKDCVANGLSSGEGLIWSVRDPITKTVAIKEKGKFTGQYETVIDDQGVGDKRLCVQEGEFANVLKVMAREGNTLSPVIRSAWDSGKLRSMTKNFPARATDAHISIVGHITREELRRLLTETESGNGFGNRFLWLAVRRSKCLPEGGNIEDENLNDLVMRLRTALEFARDAGEVPRSEAARELWTKVYPELSEGKPGLLGAITARAEAQVLRLSVIYALLDCSPVVEVEHLQAALALWSYCERCAQWIFGNATGNPNAERILAALRTAGKNGLTRTQILEDVCKRNLSSDGLDGALRSLKCSGLAYSKSEPTATKPRERWFSQARGYEFYEVSPPNNSNTSYNSSPSTVHSEGAGRAKREPVEVLRL
jgi:hypothetical protein